MSKLRDNIEYVRSVLKEWDEGLLSAAEFDCKMDDMYFNPILKLLEKDEEFMRFGSCCCSSHPPDRIFKVSITIQPHGFTIKRCE